MKTRILTAAVALPILIASIVLPAYVPQTVWLFVIIAAFALGAGLFEFYSLTKALGLKADAAVAYIGAALLFAAFLVDAPANAPDLLLLALAVVIIGIFLKQAFRFRADFSKMLAGAGVTILGVLYVAFLGGFLVAIRVGFELPLHPYLSTHLLSYFFMVIFGADTGAYFVGKAIRETQIDPFDISGKDLGRACRRIDRGRYFRRYFHVLVLSGVAVSIFCSAGRCDGRRERSRRPDRKRDEARL